MQSWRQCWFSDGDAEGAIVADVQWRMNAAKDADDTGGRDARGMSEHMVGVGEEIQSLRDCLLDLFRSGCAGLRPIGCHVFFRVFLEEV